MGTNLTVTVLHVCIPNTKRDYFDYLALPDNLPAVGARVWVSFRNTQKLGVVIGLGTPEDAKRKLKSITEVIDEIPILSEAFLKLCRWINRYYHAPLSEVLAIALPKKIRAGQIIEPKLPKPKTKPPSAPLVLNQEQAAALEVMHYIIIMLLCCMVSPVVEKRKCTFSLRRVFYPISNKY